MNIVTLELRMRSCLLAVTSLALPLSAVGQDLDENCFPIALPQQCQVISQNLASREASYESEIEILQQGLKISGDKAGILKRIAQIEKNWRADPVIRKLTQDLVTCKSRFDTTPRRQLAPLTLDYQFIGDGWVVTSYPDAAGPFDGPLRATINFSKNRCTITVNFEPLNVSVGGHSITITATPGVGTFHPLSGDMDINLDFYFDYHTDFATNDSATLPLTTSTRRASTSHVPNGQLVGIPLPTINQGLDVRGWFTLVATSTFRDGHLAGNNADFIIAGNVGPIPPVPPPPPTTIDRACLSECSEAKESCGIDGRPSAAQCLTQFRQCEARCRRH
jgi:hypothetical protein